MIVTQGSAAVSNIEDRHAFSIKANAKAFRLLSSNLYSDKPLAIMRELGCNALDSHTAAGCPEKPFKVVLPSDMHPWVEIIDFGTGLDDHEVKSIFTTYFESTKTTSNDFIGAMGLGSKSPFAYTDAFEVYARKGGIENHYTCFLNKNGAPELFLIETLKDEAFVNGVTIKVPVKAQDYHTFRNAAATAYRFFPVKPIIGTTANPVNFEQPNYGFEGTNFKVIKGDRYSYALMGPVAYPLDLKQFKHDGFMQTHMSKGLGGFLITFGIGELDVNAGREGLSYDETTIANLEKGVAGIRAEMAKTLQEEIDKEPNAYMAARFRNNRDSSDLFKLTYKGSKLDQIFYYNFTRPSALGTERVAEFNVKETSTRYIEKLKDIRNPERITLNPCSDKFFLLVDDQKKYIKKIRYAPSTERLDHAIILIPTPELNHLPGKQAFDEIVKKFTEQGVPFKYLSDIEDCIPKVERVKVAPGEKRTTSYSGFYKYSKRPMGAMSVGHLPNLTQEEMDTKSIYIKWDAKAKRYTIGGVQLSHHELTYVVWDMIDAGIAKAGLPMVIVTPKVYEKIPKDWIDVSDIIKPQIITAISEESFKSCVGDWIYTLLKLDQNVYDDLMKNSKINPFFAKLGKDIRSMTFGKKYDYNTNRFFEMVYGIRSDADEGPFKYIQDITSELFTNTLIVRAAERYYGRWNATDFKDSLILFSSLLAYGMIDEKKLNDKIDNK